MGTLYIQNILNLNNLLVAWNIYLERQIAGMGVATVGQLGRGGGGWIGASPSYTLLKIGIIKVLKFFYPPPPYSICFWQ